MRFHATLESNGKTATGFSVPEEVVAGLGSTKRPPVVVTINGHTYRSTVAVMGGRFMVGVSAENRRSADVSAGQELEVDLELDTAPREVTVPADFKQALDLDAEASRCFDNLAYSHRRRWVMSIEDAKTPETRKRRISKAIASVKEGRG